MTTDFYGDFTIKEAETVGGKFKAWCKANYDYEDCLTVGSEYEIKIIPRILPCSPLCSFMGDDGKERQCHLTRFGKVKKTLTKEDK